MGTANALVRAAILSTLAPHQAATGALEGVVVLPEPPTNYTDLFAQSAGILDMVWLGESTIDPTVSSLGPTVEYTEVIRHDLGIQIDRRPSEWTQALVDARAAEVYDVLVGILSSDPSLGISPPANNLRHLWVELGPATYKRRELASGGPSGRGHSAGYEMSLVSNSSSITTAPTAP